MAKGDSLFQGFTVKGHYKLSIHITLPDTLAANARLFSMRNTGANLLIPTRMSFRAVQAASGTAQAAIIAAFRCTSFTASDNTNASTPTALAASLQGYMTAAPGSAELATFSLVGTSGMTGGTLTKDAPFAKMPMTVLAAANANLWQIEAINGAHNGNHPLVLAKNEGIEVENLLVNTTSYGMTLVIDLAWAEVVSFGQ